MHQANRCLGFQSTHFKAWSGMEKKRRVPDQAFFLKAMLRTSKDTLARFWAGLESRQNCLNCSISRSVALMSPAPASRGSKIELISSSFSFSFLFVLVLFFLFLFSSSVWFPFIISSFGAWFSMLLFPLMLLLLVPFTCWFETGLAGTEVGTLGAAVGASGRLTEGGCC